MDITIKDIFNTSKAISKYLGFIKTFEIKLDEKLDKLINVELNTALEVLQQAEISKIEEKTLLYDAIDCFTKAIELEKKGYKKLIIAYVGLALCHKKLGDIDNIKLALNELIKSDVWSRIKKRRDD